MDPYGGKPERVSLVRFPVIVGLSNRGLCTEFEKFFRVEFETKVYDVVWC